MEKQFIDDFPTNRVNASTKILRRKTLSNIESAPCIKIEVTANIQWCTHHTFMVLA